MVPAAERWILHVDMDAFFASVEVLDDPSLAGRPLIVGGAGLRGVVASCSYEARAFGVRSAMPSSTARRLCPQAVFVAGRYDRYAEVSAAMHAVFRDYTPLVEGISLDEAFLDVSGAVRLFGPAPQIAAAIRDRIATDLSLSCSVGVATVKFLAKLASEAAKPRAGGTGGGGPHPGAGVFVVEPGAELAFLHPLPIGALWGVGPATGERLRRLGVTTVGDLARVPAATLEAALGRAHGSHLHQLAHGIDERAVEPDREVKSISHEETYPFDRFDREDLRVEILKMADSVAGRLRRAGLVGRTVNLKYRYGDFTTRTRARSTQAPVDTAAALAGVAAALLDDVDLAPGIRLLGVGISNLSPAGPAESEQMALEFEPAGDRPPQRGVDPATGAVDAIRDRFGAGAIGPAALLGADGLRVKRPGQSQWGPAAAGR